MLGIVVSEGTVSRVLRSVQRPPSQTWKTFLKNHVNEIVSTDFFTVPTVRLKVLFVFLVLEHRRREVLHFNVTQHPTSAWVAQQMMEAFGDPWRRGTYPGPRWGLWLRSPSATGVDGNRGSPDRSTESLAAGMRGERQHHERGRPLANLPKGRFEATKLLRTQFLRDASSTADQFGADLE